MLATWLPVGVAGYLGARAGWCRARLLASWIGFLGLVLLAGGAGPGAAGYLDVNWLGNYEFFSTNLEPLQ